MDLLERELLPRKSLKNLFKKGSFPREAYFVALIDSTVNIVDDGLSKDEEDGLRLSPLGSSNRLLSFYENIHKKSPSWHIALNPDKQSKGLSFSESETDTSRLFIQKGGNVGIGTTQPKYTLDVKGMVGSEGRIGTFKSGSVSANGKWQKIFGDEEQLVGNQAFEILAYVEATDIKEGLKYQRAFMHAIAVCSFGKSGMGSSSTSQSTSRPGRPPKGMIRKTQAVQGLWALFGLHKLKLRWSKWDPKTQSYNLELKTGIDYGRDKDNNQRQIVFRITKLWDDALL